MKTCNYEMFSPAGNLAVHNLIKRLNSNCNVLNTSDKLSVAVKSGLKRVSGKHEEVYDTEPRGYVRRAAGKIAQFHGYENPIM